MQEILRFLKHSSYNDSNCHLNSICRGFSYHSCFLTKVKEEFGWLFQLQFNNVIKVNFCCFKLPSGFKLIISQVLSYLDFCDYKREAFKLVESQICCLILFPLKKIWIYITKETKLTLNYSPKNHWQFNKFRRMAFR